MSLTLQQGINPWLWHRITLALTVRCVLAAMFGDRYLYFVKLNLDFTLVCHVRMFFIGNLGWISTQNTDFLSCTMRNINLFDCFSQQSKHAWFSFQYPISCCVYFASILLFPVHSSVCSIFLTSAATFQHLFSTTDAQLLMESGLFVGFQWWCQSSTCH